MRAPPVVSAAVTSAFLVGCSVFGGKAAEEPPYTLEKVDDDIEVRRYDPFTVAVAAVEGPRDEALNEGFLMLFDYITGDNVSASEIAMTAPVLTEGEGEEIAMTAPVLTEQVPAEGAEGAEIAMTAPVLTEGGEGQSWRIVFVLPEGMTSETAPRPTGENVTIEDRPGRRVAIKRYPGFNTPEKAEANRVALEGWLAAEDMAHLGDWRVAGYHPPWTIPWLRRYEVWVTLE
ncbi:MAG: heme-binding protein [Pseudomonadota bacterium]